MSGRRAGLFAYSLERAALSLSLVRYCYSIRRQARRDVCRFCQLVFLRYPLANDGEAAAGRPVGGRRSGCVICRRR